MRVHSAFALAMAVVIGVSACGDKKAAAGAATSKGKKSMADSADQVIFGQRTLITDRGLNRAQIESDTAYFFDENTRVDMRIVRGLFFSSVGAKDAVMTSRTALYNTRTQMLEAHGEVVINTIDSRTLKTPFLRYDQRTNQISSDSAFVLTEPGREVRGIGFVSDPDMNNIFVKHGQKTKAGTFTLPGQ
jgi:LPS export ABC transporter protein LptC